VKIFGDRSEILAKRLTPYAVEGIASMAGRARVSLRMLSTTS